MSGEPILRTTIIQAFARTVVDDSQRGKSSSGSSAESGGKGDGASSSELANLPGEGDIVGGLYRLMRLLGKGMFGKVYIAERVDVPEHRVALKLVPRSVYQGRNVERELVMLATVGHPHVVQLKDHGTTADYVWLTMPVYQGQTLGERLEKGPLGLRDAHDIFLAIARGLEALHAVGLRHQDVKPDNIFLAMFGKRVHPILLDLGVAAEKEAQFVAGTALYASPEQIAALNGYPGAIPLSEKMDTYCLATTLLMALVGPKKFPGEEAKTRSEIAEAQDRRAERPIPDDCLNDVDQEPRELIQEKFRRWLALEPQDRPTMSELAEELDVLLEPEREDERKEQRKRARQRRAYGRLKGFAGLLVLGALASGAVMFWKRQTIAMASQLEEAKNQKAESFDKLDTCNASHRIAVTNLAACESARDKDQTEFQKALAGLQKNGDANEAERARQMQGLTARLKACDDDKQTQQRTCADATSQLQATAAKEKADLEAKLEEENAVAQQRSAEITALTEQKQTCEADKQSCVAERDQLRGAAHGGVVAAPVKPSVFSPAPSGAPSAAPTAAPVATSAPVAPPPTSDLPAVPAATPSPP